MDIQEFQSVVEEKLNQSGHVRDYNPQGKPFYTWNASHSADSVAYSPGHPLFDGKDWLYIGAKNGDFQESVGYGMTLDDAMASAKPTF